ncbi:hypothetical protein N7532_007649 [Penicillium argentinense]|uniref:AB hydrolase-1 domain-containing protein n=1 Tax=Penicillium argentinense TaxID=1131581 RepID=A0A9W9K145_9EURO|nr:uncharacterized protein N7532_007649 [Penicillium argentinense]KAJ5088965.1 hypothetical protein N7532_007649 [Penicillium argentinense]
MSHIYESTGIQYCELRDFTFESGDTLPSVRLAYQDFNPNGKQLALIPTCFRGRINTTLSFTTGALQDYRVVVVALFGNGESSSPSNTANFPALLSYHDCVRAQHRLLVEHLKISSVEVMIGFSMGGQCTYHWAAMHPEMIINAVMICSSAKTSLHNYQFLEGPKAALVHSVDYNNPATKKMPIRGLHAFGRAYSAWLTSAEWFEQRLFEKQGFSSLGEWAESVGEKNYEDWHPENLLAMVGMWQRSDISKVLKSSDQEMSLDVALRRISTRILLMPCYTDQYFRWEASEKEAKLLSNGQLAVIPSVWGHTAGGGE